MIRINLLGGDRQVARRPPLLDASQRLTLACSSVILAAGVGLGAWYWSLAQQSERLDADLAAAQQEAARLTSLLADVRQFELRRTQQQQRVALIEQLRGGQSVPVQLLDLVSRSLPDMLWLTALDQVGQDVTIAGRSTTLIAVSDFIGSLGSSALLQKPIELVDSQVESAQGGSPGGAAAAGADLIRFTVKARLATAASAGAGARPAAPVAAVR